MRNLVQKIKEQLTVQDVDKLIHSFGGFKKEETNEHCIYSTVCHNHDSTGSFKLYYYKKSKNFFCYSNCGDFDVIGLVENVMNMEFKQAVSYLAKFLNITNSLAPVGFGNVHFEVQEYVEEEYKEVTLPVININTLDIFMEYKCYEWLVEGISEDSMNKYQISYYLEQHKIIIPHFNIDGELVGIRGRALLQEDLDAGRKYMPIFIGRKGYAHSLMHNLYGLNLTKQTIENTKKVIVFEGEKSVLIMDTYYGESNCAVAVCGSKIHRSHAETLINLGVEEVVIAFDKQYQSLEEKLQWEKKILKSLKYLHPHCTVSVIWDSIENGLIGYKDAPVDAGKKAFEYLLKNRVVIEVDSEKNII